MRFQVAFSIWAILGLSYLTAMWIFFFPRSAWAMTYRDWFEGWLPGLYFLLWALLGFALAGLDEYFAANERRRQHLEWENHSKPRRLSHREKNLRKECQKEGHDWWYLGTIHRECLRCGVSQTQDI